MKLSLLAILLGAGLGLPQLYAFANPQKFASSVRSFSRNLPAGIILMLLGTGWFVWNVNTEPAADFSAYKPAMMLAFTGVGILSCFFVQDFLAVLYGMSGDCGYLCRRCAGLCHPDDAGAAKVPALPSW